jgi:hypothetical protein
MNVHSIFIHNILESLVKYLYIGILFGKKKKQTTDSRINLKSAMLNERNQTKDACYGLDVICPLKVRVLAACLHCGDVKS